MVYKLDMYNMLLCPPQSVAKMSIISFNVICPILSHFYCTIVPIITLFYLHYYGTMPTLFIHALVQPILLLMLYPSSTSSPSLSQSHLPCNSHYYLIVAPLIGARAALKKPQQKY